MTNAQVIALIAAHLKASANYLGTPEHYLGMARSFLRHAEMLEREHQKALIRDALLGELDDE